MIVKLKKNKCYKTDIANKLINTINSNDVRKVDRNENMRKKYSYKPILSVLLVILFTCNLMVIVNSRLLIKVYADAPSDTNISTTENSASTFTITSDKTSSNTYKDKAIFKAMSITFKNADLRDILSTLALAMNVNIILAEEPVTASFQVKDMSPRTALEYLLKTLGMEYVENGNLIVVGKRETLQRDFMNQMVLSHFNLKFIPSDVVSSQIDVLGIPVKKITIEKNDKAIWIQGTPQSLSKVKELISMIDIIENNPNDETIAEKSISLTPFKLEYIAAETLERLIYEMSIDSRTLIIDANPQTIWVDAIGQALKDVEELIAKVDVVENYAIESTLPLELIPYTLNFVSPEELNKIMTEMQIDVKTLYFDSNPNKIWIDSRSKDITDFEELIVKVDLMENTKWPLNIVTQNLKNVTASKLKTVAQEIGIEAQIITLDSSAYTVWLIGDKRDILDVSLLVKELDNNKVNEGSAFFTYNLINMSPADAVTRFSYLGIEDTTVMALNYPFFSKEVLVIGPTDRKNAISELLSNMDKPGQKIRVPVDFSDHVAGQSRLIARRDLLVSLTQIPVSNFYISNNVSKDEKPHYIMWVEETPDNITRIRNMIDTIDAP